MYLVDKTNPPVADATTLYFRRCNVSFFPKIPVIGAEFGSVFGWCAFDRLHNPIYLVCDGTPINQFQESCIVTYLSNIYAYPASLTEEALSALNDLHKGDL